MTLNMTGGEIVHYLHLETDNVLDISGSKVPFVNLGSGSRLTTSGGIIGPIAAASGVTVNIRGGAIADGLSAASGSTLTVFGDDFRANGVLVAELNNIGDSVPLNFPQPTLLSGTLANGAPFSILASASFATGDYSYIQNGVFRLTQAR